MDQGENAIPIGLAAATRSRGAVQVVHQVEGVDEADDPEDREREVERVAGEQLPAEVRVQRAIAAADLDRDAGSDRQVDPVVDRADHDGGARRTPMAGRTASEVADQDHGAPNRHHRKPPR